MIPTGTTNNRQTAALAALFSSKVLRELGGKGQSPLFARLIAESALAESYSEDALIADVFDGAFRILCRTGLRHEYTYKAALIQKVLLGKHSLNTSSMLREFRVRESRADLVVLNGIATVYEIKSEKDKLDRLSSQIDDYKRVFPRIAVITCEKFASRVLDETPNAVGVSVLSDRYQISEIREANSDYTNVSSSWIFDCLRTNEAKQILEELSVPVPNCSNIQIRKEMQRLFGKIPAKEAHEKMVEVLKRTRSLQPLTESISELPQSLRPAALLTSMAFAERKTLASSMGITLRNTSRWSL